MLLLMEAAMRVGLFAEGRFLGRVIDEWADDAQEFVRTKLPRLLVVALIAFVLNRLLGLITRHMIRVAEQHAAGHGRVAQVKTLAGIIHTSGVTLITMIAGLLILRAVDIDLGPLLASAGIAGVAIGLAAQSLVKDMLTGVFILIEDQFNVGDRVRVAGFTGVVEAMTLRKTTVRDDDGTLYVIPNSQITAVANLSAGYSVATVQVSVDYSADPDRVIALLGKIAAEVRTCDRFRELFVADPQVLGVDAVKGSELVFPVIFKTKATQQYAPVRDFKRRVRLALVAENLMPGDPFRVFNGPDEPAQVVRGRMAEEAAMVAQADPTMGKKIDLNPFGGEE